MLYQVAFLRDDGTPSGVRIGSITTENHAAHRAIRLSNVQHCNTCVVLADTDEVIQVVRYYGNKESHDTWVKPTLCSMCGQTSEYCKTGYNHKGQLVRCNGIVLAL